MSIYTYTQIDEAPSWRGQWLDGDGAPVDLSAATFTVKLVGSNGTTALTKTTGVVGTVGGLVTITWGTGELNLTPGGYRLFIVARIASADRTFSPGALPSIAIIAAPT